MSNPPTNQDTMEEMIRVWREICEKQLHRFYLPNLNPQAIDGMNFGLTLCSAELAAIRVRLLALEKELREHGHAYCADELLAIVGRKP